MARYALTDADGHIVNTILWDGDPETWQPPEGLTAVRHDAAGPGGTLVDGEYTPPSPPAGEDPDA